MHGPYSNPTEKLHTLGGFLDLKIGFSGNELIGIIEKARVYTKVYREFFPSGSGILERQDRNPSLTLHVSPAS